MQVIIAKDRLSAEIVVMAGPAMTRDELAAAFAASGIVHGMDAAVVAAVGEQVVDPSFAIAREVARGNPAVAGQDGHVDLLFVAAQLAGQRRKDGSIDFHERSLLHPVAKGDELACVVEPTMGTAGRDLFGKELQSKPGKKAALRIGAGVRLTAAGRVVADRAGVVAHIPGGLDVVALWQHDGNIDLHSGNLRSTGSMLVKGDVNPGFCVEATDDVVVQGAVLDASVIAGGNVVVQQSVQGEKAFIRASGDLDCRHGTHATLVASGRLRAQDQLAHCKARGKTIELLSGRGLAFGGELRARNTVLVLQAGSLGGAATLLAAADIADDIDQQVRAESNALREARRSQKSPDAMRGKGARNSVAAVDTAITSKLERAQRQRELLVTASIEVRGIAHAGVRIMLGTTELILDQAQSNVRFRWESAQSVIVQENL